MIIEISKCLGKNLLGKLNGRKHYAELCSLIAEIPQEERVVLNFSGVKNITGSWINGAIAPFYEWVASERNNIYPLISNISADWRDDFELIAEWNHQCYLFVNSSETYPAKATLIGKLEPAQKKCLEVVMRYESVTGANLQRETDEDIQATAWNNRLKELFNKRLIGREKKGREQYYFPLVKELE